jgi:hypothetical protein
MCTVFVKHVSCIYLRTLTCFFLNQQKADGIADDFMGLDCGPESIKVSMLLFRDFGAK